MQTEDAGVKSSHPHFKFKKGNDMNDTVTKGNGRHFCQSEFFC